MNKEFSPVTINPIGYVRTDFTEKFGIPRQSGRVPTLTGEIVFLPEYRKEGALRGIEEFSHLWVLFDFSEGHREDWSPTVRPPRLGGNTRVGVFASRSPFRPNRIGLSAVKLLKVKHTETEGDVLVIGGCDLLDGTPVYDVKPYLPAVDSLPDAVGGYADEQNGHALEVVFSQELLDTLPPQKRESAVACLREDPRPSYQNDPDRVYSMLFAGFDIRFSVRENVLTVKNVVKK